MIRVEEKPLKSAGLLSYAPPGNLFNKTINSTKTGSQHFDEPKVNLIKFVQLFNQVEEHETKLILFLFLTKAKFSWKMKILRLRICQRGCRNCEIIVRWSDIKVKKSFCSKMSSQRHSTLPSCGGVPRCPLALTTTRKKLLTVSSLSTERSNCCQAVTTNIIKNIIIVSHHEKHCCQEPLTSIEAVSWQRGTDL